MPSSADYVSLATFTTLTPGETYTALVSVKRASDAPTVKIDANGVLSSTISSTVWTDVSLTFVADGTDYIRLVPQTNASGRVSVDKLQVVVGTTAGTYFDGTTSAAGDFTYEWSGAANASTALQKGLSVVTSAPTGVATGTGVRSSAQARTGTYSTVVHAPKSASGVLSDYITSLSPSSPYTASAWVKGEVGKSVYLRMEEFTSATSLVGATSGTAVVMDGTWQRVSVTRDFGATGVKSRIRVLNGSSSTHVFYYDNLMLEKSPVVQDYFDGTDTSADSDLTIVWTGTANASTSAYRGASADSYLGFGGALVSSATSQKYAGVRSAKVYYTTSASTLDNGFEFSDTLDAATTYTVSAWVYTPTGSVLPRFSVQGSGYTTVTGTAATSYNTWERISVTFTTTTEQVYYTYLLNSAATTKGTFFYVDNFMLEAASSVRDYFDGSTVSSVSDVPMSWSGTTNASTSVQTGSALTEYAPTSTGVGFAKTASSFYVGASSSYVQASGVDHGMVTTSFAAATSENSYTSSAWVKGESGKLLAIAIAEYDNADALIGTTTSSNVTMTGSWQRISVTRTFGASGVKSKTQVINKTSGPHAFYVDALMISDASYEGTYFDGSFTVASGGEFGWTGAANASTSTLTTAELLATNLVTNPSMTSVTSGSTILRTNLCTNPSMETAAWDSYDTGSEADISTIESYVGTQSTRVTPSASGTQGVTISGGSVTGGAYYTFSSYVLRTHGDSPISMQIVWYNGLTPIATSSSTGVATTIDSWTRLYVTDTAPATATSAVLNIVLNSAVAGTDIAYFDAALFEQTDQLRDFFDGATTDALGWDYGWSGTANASTSTAKATAVVTRTNLVTNPNFETNVTGWTAGGATATRVTSESYLGTAAAQVSVSSIYGNIMSDKFAITASTTYTASGYIKAAAGVVVEFRLFEYDSSNNSLGTNTFVTVTGNGAWQRVSVSRTMLSNGATASIRIAGPTASTVFYADAVLLEVSSTLGSYFDGSTGNSGDTYRTTWTGTANASTSTQSGVAISGVTGASVAAILSKDWSSTGSQSLRLIPTTVNNNARAQVDIPTTVGVTYTAKLRVRLNAALTGTLQSRSRRISAYNSSLTTQLSTSAAAANAAGVTDLSTTFVATTSTTKLLLDIGASAGNGSIWFDDLLVVEGTYVGPYFAGDTLPDSDLVVEWTGTEHASTSTLSALPIADWTSTNESYVYRSSLYTHSKGYSAKVVCNGTYSYQGIYMYNHPAVSPSNIYTASAWVLGEAGKSIRIGIQELTAAGAVVGTTYSSTIVATGSWQRYSVTRTFGSTAAKANVLISTASSVAHTFYVDDVLIDASSSVRDYFDGATGNGGDFAYAWTGTPDQSTSYEYGIGVANVDTGDSGRVAVQSTDWAGTGSRSVRVITTGTIAATDAEHGLIVASTGISSNTVLLDRNKTYTIFATLRISAAQTGTVDASRARRIWFSNDAGATVALSSTASTNSAGTYDHTLTITTSSDGDDVVFLGSGNEAGGGDLWWDKIMVVDGVYTGSYFDGSLPDTADITYIWNGDTDSSTSAITVNPVQNWTGINGAVVYRDSETKYAGAHSGRITCNGVVGLQGVQLINRATVSPSTQYFASAWVKGVSGKTLRIELQEWTTSGTYIGSSTSAGTIANGSWQRISVSRTMGASGTRAEVVVRNVQATAHTFYVDSVLLESGSVLNSYFDGSYPAQGDFSYTWNGTADASTSQYQGASVNHVASTGSFAIQSSKWKSNGSHSLRIIPTATSNDVSSADLTTFITSGLEPGKTYTVMAKVYRETLGTRVGSLSYQGFVGTTMTQNTIAEIPIAIDTHDVKITFTVANNIEAAYLKIFNNQAVGGGDIWVDDFIIIEGEYDGTYFDGDSDSTVGAFPILYQWQGTPHDSTSIRDVGGAIPAGGAAILSPFGEAERVNSTSALEITYRSGWLG